MEDIKKVLLVVNPISGAIDKSNLIKDIKQKVMELNAELILFKTTGEEDLYNLKNIIQENVPCRVIVVGGDGTIKIAAEALGDNKIPLGIIPAGSANGLAINLNLPTSLEGQLENAFTNNLKDVDVVLIEDDYCLHMSDFGLNAELVKKYEESNVRGKLGYLLQSIPTLIQSNYPFQFTIEANGEKIEKEGILLAIANASSYGTGAKVNPDGKMDDGRFEILLFKHFDFLEIIKTLRNEVDLDPEFVEIISTTQATITAQKPIAFQIDGEYQGNKKSVKVGILPRKLRLVAPL